VPGDEDQQRGGRQRRAGERPDQVAGIAHQLADHREVGRVLGGRRGQGREVAAAQLTGRGQGVVPEGLQGAAVQPRRHVLRSVVTGRAVDEGGVQPGEVAVGQQHAEVGVVGQRAVDLDGEAGRDRVLSRRGERLGQPGVALRRLEHDRGAAGPPGLEVEHHAAGGGERVRGRERLGAAEAGLLGVGEDDHDVVAQLRALGEGADRFQQRRHPGRVVGGPRAGLHRVVVRHEEEPAGRGRAGEHRDDVPDRGHPALAGPRLAGTHGVLHAGVQPQSAQRRDEPLDDPVTGGAAGHVGLRGDLLHVRERPGRAELLGRRIVGCGLRGLQGQDAPAGQPEQQGQDDEAGSPPGPPSTAGGPLGRHLGLLTEPGRDGATLGAQEAPARQVSRVSASSW
jgi:hypothetical protein